MVQVEYIRDLYENEGFRNFISRKISRFVIIRANNTSIDFRIIFKKMNES